MIHTLAQRKLQAKGGHRGQVTWLELVQAPSRILTSLALTSIPPHYLQRLDLPPESEDKLVRNR